MTGLYDSQELTVFTFGGLVLDQVIRNFQHNTWFVGYSPYIRINFQGLSAESRPFLASMMMSWISIIYCQFHRLKPGY